MLAKRIIPTILVRGRIAVKGEQFESWRSIGHAAATARVHAMRGVDELMILDIAATAEKRGPNLEMVRELTDSCFMPVTIGGGVRCLGGRGRAGELLREAGLAGFAVLGVVVGQQPVGLEHGVVVPAGFTERGVLALVQRTRGRDVMLADQSGQLGVV